MSEANFRNLVYAALLVLLGLSSYALYRIRPLGGGSDDQPITVAGGSLYLGNHHDTTWTPVIVGNGALEDKYLLYSPTYVGQQTGLIEINGTEDNGTAEGREINFTGRQTSGVELSIEMDYGSNTAAPEQTMTLASRAAGTQLLFRTQNKNAGVVTRVVNPKRMLKMLNFLRRSARNGYNIVTVRLTGITTVTGTITSPISIKDSDFNLLVHYCVPNASGCP